MAEKQNTPGGKDVRTISPHFDHASTLISGLIGTFAEAAKNAEDGERSIFFFEQEAVAKLLRKECLNKNHTDDESARIVGDGLRGMAAELAGFKESNLSDTVTTVMNEYFPPQEMRGTQEATKKAAPPTAAGPSPRKSAFGEMKESDPNLDLSMTTKLGAVHAAYAARHEVSKEMQGLDKVLGKLNQKFEELGERSGPGVTQEFCKEQMDALEKMRFTCRQSGQGTEATAKGNILQELTKISESLKDQTNAGMDGLTKLSEHVAKTIGIFKGDGIRKKDEPSRPSNAPPTLA
jgi:hypothetical protein